jgi:hypothetical protein
MGRLYHLLLLAVFTWIAAVSYAGALVSLQRTKWPVYFGEARTSGYFEVEVSQKDFDSARAGTPYDGFLSNVTIDKRKESVTADEVVIRYVENTLKQNYEQIAQAYVPGTDVAGVTDWARTFREEINGLAEVNFRSEWFYKGAKYLLIDLEYDSGASRVAGFGFRRTPRGFLLSDESEDDEGAVLDLFDYVMETIGKGWMEDYESRPFDHSIALGQGLFGVTLNVNGQLYANRKDWITPNEVADGESLQDYVEAVLASAATLENEAFVRLWCATDRDEMVALSETRESALRDAKRSHSSEGNIKHILTFAFQTNFSHYFLDESDPARIRSVFVGREGGKFCLSSGPFDRRLKGFLRSDVLKGGIWELWIAQPKA